MSKKYPYNGEYVFARGAMFYVTPEIRDGVERIYNSSNWSYAEIYRRALSFYLEAYDRSIEAKNKKIKKASRRYEKIKNAFTKLRCGDAQL